MRVRVRVRVKVGVMVRLGLGLHLNTRRVARHRERGEHRKEGRVRGSAVEHHLLPMTYPNDICD